MTPSYNRARMLAYTQALADYPLVVTWVKVEDCQGLPKHLSGYIRLEIGLNTQIPIRDLRVDEQGISGTLSFSRVPHFVVLPWEAVALFESVDEAEERIAELKKQDAVSGSGNNKGKAKVVAREGNVVRVRFGK